MPGEEPRTYTQEEIDAVTAKAAAAAEAAQAATERADAASEQIQALQIAAAKAEGERSARADVPVEANAPREFTPEELQKAVDDGEITVAAMVQQLTLQSDRHLEKRLADKLDASRKLDSQQDEIRRGIADFKEAFPEVMDPKSSECKRVKVQFDKLIARGHADDVATELLAMETVLGDPKLRARETTRETAQHEQPGGGAPDLSEGGSAEGGPPKGMSRGHIDHYERLFQMGQYPGGWTNPDVKTELKYVRSA